MSTPLNEPADAVTAEKPAPAALSPVLTRRWASPRSWTIDTYESLDGYQGLRSALQGQPGQLIELMKASGLRGRGGAGFPTGLKWSFLPQGDGKPHYLVVNADEGEPGTCKDIPLMMADPHSLIEGCLITCFAIRAEFCAIYIRGEAVHPLRRMVSAVNEARAKGYLGTNILGTGFDCEIVVHAGAGAYICGEETALLDSLEGRRGQPRLKPPFPAVAGLYASPDRGQQRRDHLQRRADRARRRRLVPAAWAPRSRPARRSTRCPAMSPGPASTRRRWAPPCGSCSRWPAA